MVKKNKTSLKFRISEFLFVILITVSSTMLAFNSGAFVLNFKRIGFSVISSMEKGVNYVTSGVKNTFSSIGELRKLRKDYDAILLKLENYEQMQRNNADIRKENERLREQLDFSLSLDEKNIPAQIIARDLDNAYAYITINKGSVNGIKKNMPVLAIQNGSQALVGKIVSVGTFTSQIMPIYNMNCMVSARIQNTRDLGLVNGMGSHENPLYLRYIRKRVVDQLHYGDIVVTSGENDNYMRDIPIGTISKISSQAYSSTLDIELTPIIDFSKLEIIIVVNQKELNDRKNTDRQEAD